jgi:hypothetical protein
MAQLTGRRMKFVEAYVQTNSASAAAIAAGYSERHSRGRAYTLLRDPKIVGAIEEIHAAVKEKSKYGLEQAVAQADDLLARALELKQMTAAANLFTTKVKLLGLLTERLLLESPDLVAAIAAGKARAALLPSKPIHSIIDITPQPSVTPGQVFGD